MFKVFCLAISFIDRDTETQYRTENRIRQFREMIEEISIQQLLNTDERTKVDRMSLVEICLTVVIVLDMKIRVIKLI